MAVSHPDMNTFSRSLRRYRILLPLQVTVALEILQATLCHRRTAHSSSSFSTFLSRTTFLGTIFCLSAFCLRSLSGFTLLFPIGELLIFAPQGTFCF
ncbi:hypothetical protein L6164_037416 [Bauhinia variegata]|uniref:Uncharacterized protein n=1 Tax=Bauhinia variegata TaxID=167791 RepID=A0ACB9KK76_BAUVA|nr:hypothetical protein L6164_037416 [Bauhinia variegata]